MNATPIHSFSSPQNRSPIEASTPIQLTASKTQTLWQRLIASRIRDTFFLPLSSNIQNKVLKREEAFSEAFWNPVKPPDLNYPHQEEIREKFAQFDQPIQIQTADNHNLKVICRIIESKEKSEAKYYNFVHVLGNLSTLNNNIASTYPFIAAYLDQAQDDPALPPARFILINQYSMKIDGEPFKPRSLDEAGAILKKVLEALAEQYGGADQMIASSLGSIILASSLKYFHGDAKELPRCFHFDRSPSSIAAASKNYWFGSLIHFLAKSSGWSIDVGHELAEFYRKGATTPCIISGVDHDHYFPAAAALHEDEKVKRNDKIKILIFDPPCQLFHFRAHHGLRADLLNGTYLVKHSDRQFLGSQEHLASRSVSYSIQPLKIPLIA